MKDTDHTQWSQYTGALLLGGASVLLIAYSVILLVQSIQNVKPIEFSDACERADNTSHNLCSLFRRPDRQSQNERGVSSGSASISINSASQFELELLPGVGPATAKKIMDNRPYESIDDLMMKKVMGEKVFETINNFLEL